MSAEQAIEKGRRGRRRKRSAEDEEEDEETVETDGSITERKGRATPGRRSSGDSSGGGESSIVTGNIVVRTFGGITAYLGGVRSEIEKVTWPTPTETRRLTLIVLATTMVAALILGLISLGFTELFRIGLQQPIILLGAITGAVVVVVYIIRRGSP